VNWLREYAEKTCQNGFVVGVSGGIDSAVVSTLCAMTGLPTMCVSLPILQAKDQEMLADKHLTWLKEKFNNVATVKKDLTNSFTKMKCDLDMFYPSLTLANMRSRLRMVALYAFANRFGYLVAGTGNKVEDYGVAFFTKYGDGGVDVSPIGDLMKTEVWALGVELGILEEIVAAKPTDGLWGDNRSDEDQIGAPYPKLEWAMDVCTEYGLESPEDVDFHIGEMEYDDNEKNTLRIYIKRHVAGAHKMCMPPICVITR